MAFLLRCFGCADADAGRQRGEPLGGVVSAGTSPSPAGTKGCDWSARIVPLLTDTADIGWFDALRAATAVCTEQLSADHASLWMLQGPGVAALAVAGAPSPHVRLGHLLLLPACNNQLYNSMAASTNGTCSEADGDMHYPGSAVDPVLLAQALLDQERPVPIVYRSCGSACEDSKPCGARGPVMTCQDRPAARAAAKAAAAAAGDRAACCAGPHGGVAAGGAGGKTCPDLLCRAGGCRQYVAVGIPAGKQMAGMLILSAPGASAPAPWDAHVLHSVAMLLSPLLRPQQVALARRTLAEVHAAVNVSELVHVLAAAAAELLASAARLEGMQIRVALVREDSSAAAVFAVGDLHGNGTSLAKHRSQDVLLVDGTGNDYFMLPQLSERERDRIGPAPTTGGTPYTTNTTTATGAPERDSVGPKGHGHAQGQGGFGGHPSAAGMLPGSLGPGLAASCRGRSLPLQHTLLSEALQRGLGLCISNCNAYVQDSKAYPRDLMLYRGSPQSLALATCAHEGRPLLALYASHTTALPQALLQAAVQELGQLLKALTPAVAEQLRSGAVRDEWRYLHDELLLPGRRTSNCSKPPSALVGAADPRVAAHPNPDPRDRPAGGTESPSQLHRTTGQLGSPALSMPREGQLALAYRTVPGDSAAAGAGGAGAGGGRALLLDGGQSPHGVRAASANGSLAALHRCGPPSAGGRRAASTAAHGQGGALQPLIEDGAVTLTGVGAACGSAATHASAAAQRTPVSDAELINVMNAVAAVLSDPGRERTASQCGSRQDSDARLAAFINGGLEGSTALTTGGHADSRLSRNGGATGRTSFSLEAACSPRGGMRLAPLITTLHERLKSAQAEQLTCNSRAASRLQDLDSLRFLELVGKGGYGSVFRGQYHGAEVAIKVVEDPAAINPRKEEQQQAGGAAAQGAGAAAGGAAAPRHDAQLHKLQSKHVHDAIELVASVSMSHPNIVQVITYFVDVRVQGVCDQQQQQQQQPHAMLPRGAAGPGTVEAEFDMAMDPDPDVPPVQLVHMTSSMLNSRASDFSEPEGNEAIVLVMEYCDRGSLKEAITEGTFFHPPPPGARPPAEANPAQGGSSVHPALHPDREQGAAAAGLPGADGASPRMNLEVVYTTLLEIALALRHMHSLHVVHCDLKPQNVLLKSNPRDPRGFTAKLSDFGLAKVMAAGEDGELVIDESIQSGTITHLPPEALQGQKLLGPGVDVFSFGICMWQIACGMNMYVGMDVKQMIRGVVRHGLRPTFPAWVPPEYKELASRCWHELPSCRPTSLQLVAELEALLYRHQTPGTRWSLAPGSSTRRRPQKCMTEAAIAGRPAQTPRMPHAASPGVGAYGFGAGAVAGGVVGGRVVGRGVGGRAVPHRQWSCYQYANHGPVPVAYQQQQPIYLPSTLSSAVGHSPGVGTGGRAGASPLAMLQPTRLGSQLQQQQQLLASLVRAQLPPGLQAAQAAAAAQPAAYRLQQQQEAGNGAAQQA